MKREEGWARAVMVSPLPPNTLGDSRKVSMVSEAATKTPGSMAARKGR